MSILKLPKKGKLCHIAATTEGATWMVEQLRELRDREGWDVSAIISKGNGNLSSKLRNENIPFETFDFEFPTRFVAMPILLGRVWTLSLLLRRKRFDVVQTHLFQSMVLGRLAAWLADVPVRLAMIASPYHLEADTPRWIDRATCWMESGLIPSCLYTLNLYRAMGIREGRLFLTYYGVDETRFDPVTTQAVDIRAEFGWSSTAPLIGMIAYFYPPRPATWATPPQLRNRANKRQEDFIQAAPIVLREFPDARFLLVGSGWDEDGPKEMQKMQELAARLGLEDQLRFTGFRSDVRNILKALDVSVQASIIENLGGTLESLLMNCPVVATRTGGMVDSIQDGVTGVLVNLLDPADLANGILHMLGNPDKAETFKRNGRALAIERFTLHSTITRLNTIYELLLHQAHGNRQWVQIGRWVLVLPIFALLGDRLAWSILWTRLQRRLKRL